jgi:UDP-2,3-diacylglucosamine hydrolase
MSLSIKENAIFIADSHYNEKKPEFLAFLRKLQTKEIQTTQLFLMGDMFDFISGESVYFIKKNKEVIDLLNELSQSIEMIYLEGNHDYNLKELFAHMQVFSRNEQPIDATYQDKSVALSHGDLYVNTSYDLYCKVIRNRPLLKFLNAIDFGHWLSKKIHFALLDKDICHNFIGFEKHSKKRVSYYKEDIVIEGHFHQGKQYEFDGKRYINIPSLTCSKEYSVISNCLVINTAF